MPQLAFWAERQPEKIAAHFPDSGAAISYGDLYARARQVAHWLIGLGLQPGDGIALLLENRPEFLEIAEATRLAGLYYTPLSIHLRPHEVAYVLQDSGAKLLIASPALAALAQDLVAEGAVGDRPRYALARRHPRLWQLRGGRRRAGLRRRRCRSGRSGGNSSIPPAPRACRRASAGR